MREAYPGLTFSGHEEWLGHRPAPSDSLPRSSGRSRVAARDFLALSGTTTSGVTAGPKTGLALAALIDGDDPVLDLASDRPARVAALLVVIRPVSRL